MKTNKLNTYSKPELDNRGNQLNPNHKEFKACKPPKDVRKFVHEMQEKHHKSIEKIIPIIQREKAQSGEIIEKGSILSKTQSAIDKCKNKNL